MTISIEKGAARGENSAVRWRTRRGLIWSIWKQLGERVEFLLPGDYQVAVGEGDEEPGEVGMYDVKSLQKGYGGAVNGLARAPSPRSFSPSELNAIFYFH